MNRALTILVAAGILLSACTQAETRGRNGEGESLLPRDRLALPAFTLDQYHALIEELHGTPVVVNIWGSWCPPCEVEAPHLARASEEFAGRVQFLGVDILDQRDAARDFILRHDWQYPSVFDPTGAIRDGLGYIGQPITLFYDRRGDLVFEWNGVVTVKLLRRQIRKIL